MLKEISIDPLDYAKNQNIITEITAPINTTYRISIFLISAANVANPNNILLISHGTAVPNFRAA